MNITARNRQKDIFTAEFFRWNRQRLAEKTQGGLIVLSAYDLMQKTSDMASPFLQEANFWYLTGIEEPGWHLVYDGTNDTALLVQPKLSEVERIFGGEPDTAAILARSGAKEVIPEENFEPFLRSLAKKHSTVYGLKLEKQEFVLNPAPKAQWGRLERLFSKVLDCSSELTKLRAIKQSLELEAIQQAVDLTVSAFEHARTKLAHCQYEFQLEAEFGYMFRMHNADHAYDPIVAAGANACTLHYGKNTDKIYKNQPILCDIGARKQYYTADITRVFVKGTLNHEQQAIYDALAKAQQQIITLIKPGFPLTEYAKSVEYRYNRVR
jgi:Xaa-Pro aminopeptidase